MSAVTNLMSEAEAILTDAASSVWMRSALESALKRDPVDAVNDALALAAVLEAHLRAQLGLDE